jgi:hypothetical protein
MMEYKKEIPVYGDLMEASEWLDAVDNGFFTDYDGFAKPVKDNLMADTRIYPSNTSALPDDATHVVWFNR